jgi:hypothetical protein
MSTEPNATPQVRSEEGYTIAVYLPPQADPQRVQEFKDRISVLAHEGFFANREGWDPFVYGYAGDVLQVNHDCECCPPHVYLSTSCFHGDHNYCKRETGLLGTKIPSVCKFCQAPCVCQCHSESETEKEPVDG